MAHDEGVVKVRVWFRVRIMARSTAEAVRKTRLAVKCKSIAETEISFDKTDKVRKSQCRMSTASSLKHCMCMCVFLARTPFAGFAVFGLVVTMPVGLYVFADGSKARHFQDDWALWVCTPGQAELSALSMSHSVT